MSDNRGKSWLASLFSFDPTTKVATLLENNDGPTDEILLPGRVLDLRARKYPTGRVRYRD